MIRQNPQLLVYFNEDDEPLRKGGIVGKRGSEKC